MTHLLGRDGGQTRPINMSAQYSMLNCVKIVVLFDLYRFYIYSFILFIIIQFLIYRLSLS